MKINLGLSSFITVNKGINVGEIVKNRWFSAESIKDIRRQIFTANKTTVNFEAVS